MKPAIKKFTNLILGFFFVIVLASSEILTSPTPALASEGLTVSVANPIIGQQVTIRATGFANPQDYDVLYVIGVDGYFPGSEGNGPLGHVWIGSLDSGGTWSGSWVLDFEDNGSIDESGIFAGVVTLRAKTLRDVNEELGTVYLDDLENVGVQLFPGKNRIGSPKLSFSGPGFVNGSFVVGQGFTVTGTGFPAGAEFAAAIVFPNPTPSNDINVDFWRWFYEEGMSGGPEDFFFQLLADEDNPNVLVGYGEGLDLADKSVWFYYFGGGFDEGEELPQFGYGVYSASGLGGLSKNPSRVISNYFIAEGFEKGKAKLNKPMRKFIRKELSTRSGEVNVVCTGTVRGKKWTPKREELALARAASGCNFVSKLSPEVPVELRKRLIPKGKGDPHTVRIRVFY
jgi:hypothetical protein